MAEPWRVLFVAGSLGGGGAERQLVDLITHLDPQRISPRLYLAYRRGELLPEVSDRIPLQAFWDGASQRSFGQRLAAKLHCPCAARALHLREVLRRHPVDAVISWSLLCSYEVALALIGQKTVHLASVINEPQGDLDDAFPPGWWFRRQRAVWAYASAKMVMANSADLCDKLTNFYRLAPAKVETLYNTRDFERIDRLAAGEAPLWPGTGRRVLAAGRLHRQKGFDVLLKAIARLSEGQESVQLAILGQGPEEDSLRRLAEELAIGERVRFLGFQENPFVYYRAADAFVLSSRFEGMPNVLLEAMACRTPVVSTDCPTGPREILENGRFGPLVPVDDVDALAAALGNVLEHPPSVEQRESARASVWQRFSIAAGVRRFEELLQRALGESRQRQAEETP